MKNAPVVLGITGSIAAYKACDIIRGLQDAGFTVDAIMTKEAQEFITPLTIQTISGRKTYCDMFDATVDYNVEHIGLAQRAACVLIAPATATVIGKLASGIYDDLLTCVVSATKAPVLIAPAMNTNMFENPVVQGNIEKLKKLGVTFIGPRKGKLACGDVGLGCLEDIAVIIDSVKKALKS